MPIGRPSLRPPARTQLWSPGVGVRLRSGGERRRDCCCRDHDGGHARCRGGGHAARSLDGGADRCRKPHGAAEVGDLRERRRGPCCPAELAERHAQECAHDLRRELHARAPSELGACGARGHRPLVRTDRGHHLVRVGDRYDRRRPADLVAPQLSRVPRTVPPFVMAADRVGPVTEECVQRTPRVALRFFARHDAPTAPGVPRIRIHGFSEAASAESSRKPPG
jgi:hypothetical protein